MQPRSSLKSNSSQGKLTDMYFRGHRNTSKLYSPYRCSTGTTQNPAANSNERSTGRFGGFQRQTLQVWMGKEILSVFSIFMGDIRKFLPANSLVFADLDVIVQSRSVRPESQAYLEAWARPKLGQHMFQTEAHTKGNWHF